MNNENNAKIDTSTLLSLNTMIAENTDDILRINRTELNRIVGKEVSNTEIEKSIAHIYNAFHNPTYLDSLNPADIKDFAVTSAVLMQYVAAKLRPDLGISPDTPYDEVDNILKAAIEAAKNRSPLKLEPKLFQQNIYERVNSSAIIDSLFSICITKNGDFEESLKELSAKKKYSNGGVIEIVLEELQQSITSEFGTDTMAIALALTSHILKTGVNEEITISGNDIIDYLGKKNQKTSKGDKRIAKINKLKEIAHHCHLLGKLKVYVGNWGAKNVSIADSSLFVISKDYEGQRDIYGEIDMDTVTNLHITYKLGRWFDKLFYKEYGYCNKEALSSSNENARKIGQWLSFKLRQHQTGEFKIRTVLEGIGLKDKINQIIINNNGCVKSNFKRSLDRTFEDMDTWSEPYVRYYKKPPQWITDTSTKKPQDWFEQWLDLVIFFKQPACLDSQETIEKKAALPPATNKSDKPAPDPKHSVDDLVKAMGEHNIGIRPLAKWYGMTYYQLQNGIKNKKLTQGDLKNLLNGVSHLSKKKEKPINYSRVNHYEPR